MKTTPPELPQGLFEILQRIARLPETACLEELARFCRRHPQHALGAQWTVAWLRLVARGRTENTE